MSIEFAECVWFGGAASQASVLSELVRKRQVRNYVLLSVERHSMLAELANLFTVKSTDQPTVQTTDRIRAATGDRYRTYVHWPLYYAILDGDDSSGPKLAV